MGRPRNSDDKLPRYVYLAKGRYVYRPYKDGKLLPERRLCSGTAPRSEVWAAYEAAVSPDASPHSFRWLARKYLKSETFRALARATRKDYAQSHAWVCAAKLKSGSLFGDMPYHTFTPGVMRKYLDARAAKTRGNRELAFMSAVFAWAYERDLVAINPCHGVRRNKERARDRYVTPAEYQRVYDQANPQVQIAMEIAYLCMARKRDILALRREQLLEIGIQIRQGKTGVTQIKRWSPRLRAAIDRALALPATIASVYVLHNRYGQPLNSSSFDDMFGRATRKAMQAGLSERFTFHDLKAAGISDYEGDKGRASGHKSPAMVARYNRKPDVVDPTE